MQPAVTAMVTSLNDDRRDAISWLVSQLRWERTLDRLRLLEAAMSRCPHVIFYRVNPLTAHMVMRRLLLPYVGLPNVLAGRFVVPEFIQDEASVDNLARAALNVYDDLLTRRRTEAPLGSVERMARVTPATRAAARAGIDFRVHEYTHVAGAEYGAEAAAQLGVDAARVFKTLVASMAVALRADNPDVAADAVIAELRTAGVTC